MTTHADVVAQHRERAEQLGDDCRRKHAEHWRAIAAQYRQHVLQCEERAREADEVAAAYGGGSDE
jgi:hypothetical protein